MISTPNWTTKPLPAINREGVNAARFLIGWVVTALVSAFVFYVALRGAV